MRELQPHEQRVVEEKAELDKKIVGLSTFLGSENCNDVPSAQIKLMISQGYLMHQYSTILRERIALFNLEELPVVEDTEPPVQIIQTHDSTMIEVTDMNMFADMLIQWHKKTVSDMSNLLLIPEGSAMTHTNEDGTESTLVMTGDALGGFKCAAVVGLSLLKSLPFKEMQNE